MPHDSELASSWVPKVMLAVFIIVPVAVLATCVALITAYVTSDSEVRDCRDTTEGLLAIEPPPFLLKEPCADNYFFMAYVTYSPVTPQAPTLQLFEFIAGGREETATRNPVQWSETIWGDRPAYGAAFVCDGLVIEAKASWDGVNPVNQPYALAQLDALAGALDTSCATYDFVPLPTREPG